MADRGTFRGESGAADVTDVQKVGKKVWVHFATVTGGELAVGQKLTASVDDAWRHQARQAHSGTHLIHAALRNVLAQQCRQVP